MTLQLIAIGVLVLAFVLGTVTSLNLGVIGLAATFVIGILAAGLSTDDAIAGFPVDLMMILVGVTYLFNIARANGTVDWLIAGAVAGVRGRTPFIPWIMFLLTALLSAVGAVFSPPIVAPIALAFAARHRIPQPMMGIMVVHGAAAGSLSPISVYGVTVAGVLDGSGLPGDPWGLFGIAFLASLLPAIAVFVYYRGYRTAPDPAPSTVPSAGASTSASGSDGASTSASASASGSASGSPAGSTSVAGSTGAGPPESASAPEPTAHSPAAHSPAAHSEPATRPEPAVRSEPAAHPEPATLPPASPESVPVSSSSSPPGSDSGAVSTTIAERTSVAYVRPTAEIVLTALAIAAMFVGAILELDVGLLAMTLAVVLGLYRPAHHAAALRDVPWTVVLLVGGTITYVGVLQEIGAIDLLGNGAIAIGAPLATVLLLGYLAGVVSAFASSAGTIAALTPLAVPLVQGSGLAVLPVVAVIAISATIVDVSPFSGNGAAVIANATEDARERVYRTQLFYGGLVVLVAPLLLWLAVVVPA